jgi:acyl-homoserine-lactone acylase
MTLIARFGLCGLLTCSAILTAQPGLAAPAAGVEARWATHAKNVTIVRDTWGIPHIYGKTDADAVFGMLYAHAEDDFKRIEFNYINAMGRLSEVEGEAELMRDLRMKLFIEPADLQAKYRRSPAWLQNLMTAWADGLNYYLVTHPAVKPALITRFEPWMALSFSEGSIGGDIESISVKGLYEMYWPWPKAVPSQRLSQADSFPAEPRGSNGFAIAPANSASGKALLLINPHTSFYFRGEAQVVSEEGLNAYGAATWGQFFIYQGFNEHNGWMHTSGGADVIDEYAETVIEKDGKMYYQYAGRLEPVKQRKITLSFKIANRIDTRDVTALYTRHGPIVRRADGKWISVKLMNDPVLALEQSWLRTKTANYQQFLKVMDLRTNSSNNTVYADRDGNIAYFHGNFVPQRDPRFNWTKPVDGSDPATEWKGLHKVADTIHLLNPKNGWLQNTNTWPFAAAGLYSPKRENYPAYMWSLGDNPRGPHALAVLQDKHDFTLDSLIEAAYDSKLTAFDALLPALVKAYADTPVSDPQWGALVEQMETLRGWDGRYAVNSVATSLAIYWAQDLSERFRTDAQNAGVPLLDFIARSTTPKQKLFALAAASDKLQRDFGSWKTPWGEINRFQRINDDIASNFDDDQPSLPVAFASSAWGSLAAFGVTAPLATRKIYGTRGNSFVAVVEFGKPLHAKAIMAGGQSGDQASRHFRDQAPLYAKGQFREVLFYREDVVRNSERIYHPGS